MNFQKLLLVALIGGIFFSVNPVTAQTARQEKKEQKADQNHQKETRQALFAKADKMAIKEAKQLKKDGWKTMGLPIEKQLEQTWMKMYETGSDGYATYITSQQMTTANSFAAAQSQNDNVAKLRIASQIASSIGALTDIALANQEISPKEAASIGKVVENAKVLVSLKLGRVVKTLEIYRIVNGNYQVRTTMVYNMKAAITLASEVILEELKKDSDVNKAQLEKIMGMDQLMQETSDVIPDFDEVAE